MTALDAAQNVEGKRMARGRRGGERETEPVGEGDCSMQSLHVQFKLAT